MLSFLRLGLDLLRLLETFKEHAPLEFTVLAQENRIEVSRLDSFRVISPRFEVGVRERCLERPIVLLLPLLELLRHRSIDGILHFFDLFAVKPSHIIIKDLPLLRRSLVCADRHIILPLLSNDVLDPVLEFNEGLLCVRVVLEATQAAIMICHLTRVVVFVIINFSSGATEVNGMLFHLFRIVLEVLPELSLHLI